MYILIATSTPGEGDPEGQSLEWAIREGNLPIFNTIKEAKEAVDYDISMCGDVSTRKEEHPNSDLWVITYNGDGVEAPADSVVTTFIRRLN